jgi:Domain of unknown function (DUF4410)
MNTNRTMTGQHRGLAGGPTPSTAKLTARAVALAGLAALAACTSAQGQMETTDTMLPAPQVVIVETFAVSPDQVKLDQGLSTEIEQAVRERRGTSRTEQETQAGQQVADAIADKLVVEIQDMGLRAQRGSTVPAGTQNALLIKGQLVSIDEGNRTERVIVGLGAGRSDVRSQVQVYEVTPSGSRLIDTIEVDAKSGLTPGMAETMGVGGLAGHLVMATVVSGGVHVASEARGADVVADADRAAMGIAKQLAALFAQESWKLDVWRSPKLETNPRCSADHGRACVLRRGRLRGHPPCAG